MNETLILIIPALTVLCLRILWMGKKSQDRNIERNAYRAGLIDGAQRLLEHLQEKGVLPHELHLDVKEEGISLVAKFDDAAFLKSLHIKAS
jgi:hypothetical protein